MTAPCPAVYSGIRAEPLLNDRKTECLYHRANCPWDDLRHRIYQREREQPAAEVTVRTVLRKAFAGRLFTYPMI